MAEAHTACIGILGGGGKTTLLHALGDELAAAYSPVVLTALTKSGLCERHPFRLFSEIQTELLEEQTGKKPLYIMRELESEEKLLGIRPGELLQLHQASAVTVFEADGARKRPLKAHQPYDPVLPDFSTHAIILVGADAVGAKVDGKRVHRPELFRELWQVNANFILDPAFIAKVVTSRYGYLQKVPSGITTIYLVNKADRYPKQASQLAQAIQRVSNAPVFLGSLEQGSVARVYPT